MVLPFQLLATDEALGVSGLGRGGGGGDGGGDAVVHLIVGVIYGHDIGIFSVLVFSVLVCTDQGKAHDRQEEQGKFF